MSVGGASAPWSCPAELGFLNGTVLESAGLPPSALGGRVPSAATHAQGEAKGLLMKQDATHAHESRLDVTFFIQEVLEHIF